MGKIKKSNSQKLPRRTINFSILLVLSSTPPFSHRIESIGYPENGQNTMRSSPAIALIGLMARTYGGPNILRRAVCDTEPTLFVAVHLYNPPSSVRT
jgi:hypothetical protein